MDINKVAFASEKLVNQKESSCLVIPIIIQKHLEEVLGKNVDQFKFGFLFGETKKGIQIVKKIWPVQCPSNSIPSDQSFVNRSRKAKYYSKNWKMELLGIFYSNPGIWEAGKTDRFNRVWSDMLCLKLILEDNKKLNGSAWRLDTNHSFNIPSKVVL